MKLSNLQTVNDVNHILVGIRHGNTPTIIFKRDSIVFNYKSADNTITNVDIMSNSNQTSKQNAYIAIISKFVNSITTAIDTFEPQIEEYAKEYNGSKTAVANSSKFFRQVREELNIAVQTVLYGEIEELGIRPVKNKEKEIKK